MYVLTEEMFKSFQPRPFSQGEVNIWHKDYCPADILEQASKNSDRFKPMKLEGGKLILGHSETGHHHTLEPLEENATIEDSAQALIDELNDAFITLKLHKTCKLEHHRSNDTHGAYILPPGEYIRGIREEQTVEGWRRVQD